MPQDLILPFLKQFLNDLQRPSTGARLKRKGKKGKILRRGGKKKRKRKGSEKNYKGTHQNILPILCFPGNGFSPKTNTYFILWVAEER
jgi:hypothetical protein